MIVLESMFVVTWRAALAGMLALINPVITLTDGLCVANIKCIPAALAFAANLVIRSSTFFPTLSIISANSSITTTM